MDLWKKVKDSFSAGRNRLSNLTPLPLKPSSKKSKHQSTSQKRKSVSTYRYSTASLTHATRAKRTIKRTNRKSVIAKHGAGNHPYSYGRGRSGSLSARSRTSLAIHDATNCVACRTGAVHGAVDMSIAFSDPDTTGMAVVNGEGREVDRRRSVLISSRRSRHPTPEEEDWEPVEEIHPHHSSHHLTLPSSSVESFQTSHDTDPSELPYASSSRFYHHPTTARPPSHKSTTRSFASGDTATKMRRLSMRRGSRVSLNSTRRRSVRARGGGWRNAKTSSTVPIVEGMLETPEVETQSTSPHPQSSSTGSTPKKRYSITSKRIGSRTSVLLRSKRAGIVSPSSSSFASDATAPRVSVQKLEGLMRNIRVYSVQDGLELGVGEMEGWEDLEDVRDGEEMGGVEKVGGSKADESQPPAASIYGNRSSGSAPSMSSTTTVHRIPTTANPDIQTPPAKRSSTVSTASTSSITSLPAPQQMSDSPLPPELDYEPVRKDANHLTPDSSFMHTPRGSVSSTESGEDATEKDADSLKDGSAPKTKDARREVEGKTRRSVTSMPQLAPPTPPSSTPSISETLISPASTPPLTSSSLDALVPSHTTPTTTPLLKAPAPTPTPTPTTPNTTFQTAPTSRSPSPSPLPTSRSLSPSPSQYRRPISPTPPTLLRPTTPTPTTYHLPTPSRRPRTPSTTPLDSSTDTVDPRAVRAYLLRSKHSSTSTTTSSADGRYYTYAPSIRSDARSLRSVAGSVRSGSGRGVEVLPTWGGAGSTLGRGSTLRREVSVGSFGSGGSSSRSGVREGTGSEIDVRVDVQVVGDDEKNQAASQERQPPKVYSHQPPPREILISSRTDSLPSTPTPTPPPALPPYTNPLRRITSFFSLGLPRPSPSKATPTSTLPGALQSQKRTSVSSATTDVTIQSVTTVGGGKEKRSVRVRRKVGSVFGFSIR
ncbi:hypothetical protein HDV00_004523 [Rhizophlyctis rosea]|nr:hypothetical protein HDV00_004523 [Rhizophlyctis rosea]